MGRLSIWTRVNLVLSGLILLSAFAIPKFQNASYHNTMNLVESSVKNLAKEQSLYFANHYQYCSVKKSKQSDLIDKLKFQKSDMKYYTYTITTSTSLKNFTILVEPKVKYLQTREIPALFYKYEHIDGATDKGKWSNSKL